MNLRREISRREKPVIFETKKGKIFQEGKQAQETTRRNGSLSGVT